MADGGGGMAPEEVVDRKDGKAFCLLVMRCLSTMDLELRRIWASVDRLLELKFFDMDLEDEWYQATIGKQRLELKRDVGALLRDNVDLQHIWTKHASGVFGVADPSEQLKHLRNMRGCFHGGPYYRVFLHEKTKDAVDGFSTRSIKDNFELAKKRGWRAELNRQINFVNPSGNPKPQDRYGFLAAWLTLPPSRRPNPGSKVATDIRQVAMLSCLIQDEDDDGNKEDSRKAQIVVWTAAFLARLWLDVLIDVWNSVREIAKEQRVKWPVSEMVGAHDVEGKQRVYDELTRGNPAPDVQDERPGSEGLKNTAAGRLAPKVATWPIVIYNGEFADENSSFLRGVNHALDKLRESGTTRFPIFFTAVIDDVNHEDTKSNPLLAKRTQATVQQLKRHAEREKLNKLKLSTKKRAALLRAKYLVGPAAGV
jgi:hypothetical protein